MKHTLPETNIAPEINGRLVSFWEGLFSGAMLVSGRVNVSKTLAVFDYKKTKSLRHEIVKGPIFPQLSTGHGVGINPEDVVTAALSTFYQPLGP